MTIHHLITRPRESLRLAAVEVLLWTMAVPGAVQRHWQEAKASGDSGSETVGKAVIVAIVLGLAVGLGVAITAVVHKYQAQIK